MSDTKTISLGTYLPYVAAPILTGLLQPFFESLGQKYITYIALILVWIGASGFFWYKKKDILGIFNITLMTVVVVLIVYLVTESDKNRVMAKETIDITVQIIEDCNKNLCRDGIEKVIAEEEVSLVSRTLMPLMPKETDSNGKVTFKNIDIEDFPLTIKVCGQARTHRLKAKKNHNNYKKENNDYKKKKENMIIEIFVESKKQCKV